MPRRTKQNYQFGPSLPSVTMVNSSGEGLDDSINRSLRISLISDEAGITQQIGDISTEVTRARKASEIMIGEEISPD